MLVAKVHWEVTAEGGRCWVEHCDKESLWLDEGSVKLLETRQVCRAVKRFDLADQAKKAFMDDGVFSLVDTPKHTEIYLHTEKLPFHVQQI